jgi:hypothetical protein
MRQRGVTPLMYQSGETAITNTREDDSLACYWHPLTPLFAARPAARGNSVPSGRPNSDMAAFTPLLKEKGEKSKAAMHRRTPKMSHPSRSGEGEEERLSPSPLRGGGRGEGLQPSLSRSGSGTGGSRSRSCRNGRTRR